MWSDKQRPPNTPSRAPAPGLEAPGPSSSAPETLRPASPIARSPAWLGPSLRLKGEISGDEDLHIDGEVEGPVSLGGHRLTVGRTGKATGEMVAREVVVYGKVDGDLRARDRIEIKKDGSVVGDLTTARIVIEDGAYFKGSIEIERSNTQVGTDLEGLLSRAGRETD